jgi:molybdenum cofactor guanylyltransferase
LATLSPEATLDNTTLLVLCGGAGHRMQGKDKPLLLWRGKPMVQRILATVPADMPKLISANRNLNIYRQWAPVVTDQPETATAEEYQGPLAGILSGLRACKTPWLLVCPGDTPALPEHWFEPLMKSVDSHVSGAVVHDGERQQHLHLLLRHCVKTDLERFLAAGGYQVCQWLSNIQLAVVEFNNSSAFKNINFPEELT